MKRCATEYHCLCAKNGFYRRWEAPLAIAFACNADCIGCISLQTEGLVPASHERVTVAPTLEELSAVALPHLTEAEEAIVSFGQGCEGEPLLQEALIEATIQRVRAQTDRGTIHLNTNGSLPRVVERLCRAGLDSIRVSLNSTQPEAYAAYYRPKGYSFTDVVESIRVAKACGCYTAINLLVFPGVSDREEEVEGLLRLIAETGLELIQMKNLNIDPRRYIESLPPPRGRTIGMRELLRVIRREVPHVEIGYFNRPKEHFARSLSAGLTF
jgi:molybdenum cofactor biosynthesis enzyme MoaA